jgi:hypothetical protein
MAALSAPAIQDHPWLSGSSEAIAGAGSRQVDAPFQSDRTASAPAAPVSAARAADATTSHRLLRGRSRHDERLAITSRESDRAPAAIQAQADPGSAARCRNALSAPIPRATSRAPTARPSTRPATSPAAAPTSGRASTDGHAMAVRRSATRPTATAQASRRSSAATVGSASPALFPPGGHCPPVQGTQTHQLIIARGHQRRCQLSMQGIRRSPALVPIVPGLLAGHRAASTSSGGGDLGRRARLRSLSDHRTCPAG